FRNTDFARQFADSIGHVPIPADIEADTPSGEAARRAVGGYLDFHAYKEFSIPGVHLGTRYEGSPIVATETANAPPDTANLYLPSGLPGHRAPHVWLDGQVSLFDRFGQGFTLLRLGAAAQAAPPARLPGHAPVHDLPLDCAQARDLYGADYVLVRPDQHIAWRGNRLDEAFSN